MRVLEEFHSSFVHGKVDLGAIKESLLASYPKPSCTYVFSLPIYSMLLVLGQIFVDIGRMNADIVAIRVM